MHIENANGFRRDYRTKTKHLLLTAFRVETSNSHNTPFLPDNVHHYAHICEVISVRLVMAVTSYPIFSHHGDHDEQVK